MIIQAEYLENITLILGIPLIPAIRQYCFQGKANIVIKAAIERMKNTIILHKASTGTALVLIKDFILSALRLQDQNL